MLCKEELTGRQNDVVHIRVYVCIYTHIQIPEVVYICKKTRAGKRGEWLMLYIQKEQDTDLKIKNAHIQV